MGIRLTPLERRMMKYSICERRRFDLNTMFLRVDHQLFEFVYVAPTNKLEWFRKNLSKALARIVESELARKEKENMTTKKKKESKKATRKPMGC